MEHGDEESRDPSMEVVSASHGALGPLLGKLTALLADECARLKGVRRGILSLRSELEDHHAELQRYTELEDPDEQVIWIYVVRELTYDIEDWFDKFIHQLGNGGDHGGFKEFVRETVRHLRTLGSHRRITKLQDRIKQVKELRHPYKLDRISSTTPRYATVDPRIRALYVKQVKERKDCYKLDENYSGTTRHAAVDPRLHALFAEQAHLVGIDGPRDDLVKWMVEEENSSPKHRLKVLSIVGFGGLGKTTLANEVYRKIQADFHCHAFVSISQKGDLKKIIKDVISQVSSQDEFPKNTDDWDGHKYITKLREFLQDKRYLVIVDDIWSAYVWDAIKCAFPENNYSSRIIVTTRNVDLAMSCCPKDDDRMYEMKALSDLQSRRLFFKRIFGSEDCCPEMMEVSNKILKICGGLPLAITSISSLLANIPAVKEEWEKVKRLIGSALEKNQSLEGMTSILTLSYNDLPSNLKTCFLYLSIFPKNYVIERETLVRRWIAEGFISKERGLSQQDIGEQYFYELINKSMVQPVKTYCDGKVNACRVHEMMLEFIISRSAKDNFFTVVDSGQTGLSNRQGFIRRLSIHHIDQELVSLANEDMSHVRSLSVTSSSCIKHLPSLTKFEALRVLHFEECSDDVEKYIMNDMDKLFQLKYLGVKGTRISKLPRGIVKLRDLETLDLRDTNINELPAAIVELTKMQYLLISSEKGTQQGKVKIPTGISKMINLRAISGFNINKSLISAVEELGNLARLNELHLQLEDRGSNEHEKMFLSSLGKLCSCNLQSLRIHKRRGSVEMQPPSTLKVFHLSGDYCVMDISKWNALTLTMLVHLSINLTELKEDGLRTLGELPALRLLELSFIAGPKEMITVEGTGFQSLKKLVIYSVAGAYVTFMVRAMPMLENLEVRYSVSVAKVHGFGLGIQHLRRLKEAVVSLYKVDVTSSDIKAAVAAIRDEADNHPNSPTIDISDEKNEEAGSSSSQAARGFMRDAQVAYLREHPRPPAPVDPTDKGKQVISEPMEYSDDEM